METEHRTYPGKHFAQFGSSILELLVATSITMTILGGVVSAITITSRQGRDDEIRMRTHEVARAILDYMVFDIRLLGAGMPVGQQSTGLKEYTPAGGVVYPPAIVWGNSPSNTGDAFWPLLPNSDQTHIVLRLNERGVDTVLSADYNAATGDTASVMDLSDFMVGDIVYIYDRRNLGNAGVRASIVARSPAENGPGRTPGTITLNASRDISVEDADYVFGAGSSVNRVSTVTYVSPPDNSGIQLSISDYDPTLRLLYPGTSFELTYIDRAGAPIALPGPATTLNDVIAVRDAIKFNLASILVSVTARGETPLSDGTVYTARATQEVTLRNLMLSYYADPV